MEHELLVAFILYQLVIWLFTLIWPKVLQKISCQNKFQLFLTFSACTVPQRFELKNSSCSLYQGLQYQYQYQYQKSILGPSIPIPIPILSKFWPSIPIPIPRPLNTNTRGLNTTKVVLNLNFSNSALQIFEADFTKIKNIFRFYFILLDFKTKFYFGKLIFFAF